MSAHDCSMISMNSHIDSSPENAQMLHHAVRMVLAERDAQLGEHTYRIVSKPDKFHTGSILPIWARSNPRPASSNEMSSSK